MPRCFIALDIPKNVRKSLWEICKEISEFKWAKVVRRENLHITIKFLGEINQKAIERTKVALGKEELKSFFVRCRGIGGFPNNERPRVVWAGAESKALKEMVERINRALGHLFPEDKAFRGHITLARFRRIPKGIEKYINERKNMDFGGFKTSEFYLVQSELTKKGPIYSVLERFELSGNGHFWKEGRGLGKEDE